MAGIHIVGVDCATDPRHVGLALGTWHGGPPVLHEAEAGISAAGLRERLLGWLSPEPVLLALDAPLGWPAPLGRRLQVHRAGEPLDAPADALFRRAADVHVHRRLGKLPLDVGADRIARTAHWALGLLQALRAGCGRPIPLAWEPAALAGTAVIEVYPAATLRALGLPSAGYKRAADAAVRDAILAGLARHLRLEVPAQRLLAQADVLDAAVCVLAGADFLAGRAVAPENARLAREEGWIWVRARGDGEPGEGPGR